MNNSIIKYYGNIYNLCIKKRENAGLVMIGDALID
jgi:hypothetical protein